MAVSNKGLIYRTGLGGVELFAVSLDSFISDRALSSAGRFARHHLGREAWERFVAAAAAELRESLGSDVRYRRGALIATGLKP